MYVSPCAGSLRQSDIIGPVKIFEFKSAASSSVQVEERVYNYAAILSQDCDLEQDYVTREQADPEKQDKLLYAVLMCGVYPEAVVLQGKHRRGAEDFKSQKTRWKLLQQNRDSRYQYLGYVEPVNKTLVADFKDYFFVPTAYLYEQVGQHLTVRQASMDSPWRDHLLQRFGFYMTRIGLPQDFHTLGPAPP